MERNKALGPYEIIGEVSAEGRVLVDIPWEKVIGGQVIVAVSDNYSQLQTTINDPQYWATAEVSIWGVVQGYAEVLKRQQLRMLSGPMLYQFANEEAYHAVRFRARNFTGGRRGSGASGANAATAENGYSLTVQLFLQPRSGFGL